VRGSQQDRRPIKLYKRVKDQALFVLREPLSVFDINAVRKEDELLPRIYSVQELDTTVSRGSAPRAIARVRFCSTESSFPFIREHPIRECGVCSSLVFVVRDVTMRIRTGNWSCGDIC